MKNVITLLKARGLDYGVQAHLVGVNPISLRRWEERDELPAHTATMLSACERATRVNPHLADEIVRQVYEAGILRTWLLILQADLSITDT